MPTSFVQPVDNVDQAVASHVNQYAGPVNRLEDGSAHYSDDTGSANAYVVSPPTPPPSPLTNGYPVLFRASASNTGASTLNAGTADGAVAIKKNVNEDLEPNDILAGQMVLVFWDDVNNVWQFVSAPRAINKTDILKTFTTNIQDGQTVDVVVDQDIGGYHSIIWMGRSDQPLTITVLQGYADGQYEISDGGTTLAAGTGEGQGGSKEVTGIGTRLKITASNNSGSDTTSVRIGVLGRRI